ncbi:hypothetical protein FDECE_3794 [Fusarium decemcellulare]|nr:hypothetical protein FDECE_3794 [Fusarium decemcellulare]
MALRRPFTNPFLAQANPSRILVRAKSLSAIHRGMRSSERAQYGEPYPRDSREPRDRGAFDRRPQRRASASPARREASSHRDDFMDKFNSRVSDGTRTWRQDQKLRKKLRKKLEEQKAKEEAGEEEGGRRTRRKRFIDGDTDFGKRSLVYQLKYGELKDVGSKLPVKQFVEPRSFRDSRRDRRFDRPERDNGAGRISQDTMRRFDRSDRQDSPRKFDRSDRQDTARRFDRSDRQDTPRRFDRSDQSAYPRQDNTRTERWGNEDQDLDDAAPRRGRKKEMMAMTIKYTTAASQFLYGRSVVKAALEQGRRKLYNLYIYGGENRRDDKDNTTMTRLAKKLNIPITIVPTGEQRLMDKMSMGRPHNGFVLEASPLPQLPLKSLGKLEESPERLGFHVELEFQTKEERSINGTDSFIHRANDTMPKPFVLLLNEIIDPGNLGGIIRTASYFGVDAVGITSRGSSTLTPVALKSAAGAVEEITLFTVDDPLQFIEGSKKAGWKTFAAVAPPDRKLVRKHGDKFMSTEAVEAQSPLNEHPCLLVLGNEGHGLSKPLKVAADYELSVPRFVQGSCVDSLNVSVAGALLCHSFVKEPRSEVKTVVAETRVETLEAENKPATGAAQEESTEIEPETKSEEVDSGKKPEERQPEEKQPEEKAAEKVEMVF